MLNLQLIGLNGFMITEHLLLLISLGFLIIFVYMIYLYFKVKMAVNL